MNNISCQKRINIKLMRFFLQKNKGKSNIMTE